MNNLVKNDVVIIGGGVAGLYTAYKLSLLGLKIMLVEEQMQLANGPSARNGGLIHRGTFHSALVDDEDKAFQVAKRCIYGFEQIKTFAPECIETSSLPLYALIKDEKLMERATKRWKKWNIPMKHISYKNFSQEIEGVNAKYANYIFEVADAPVNYRILYQRLLVECERRGVTFVFGSSLIPGEENNAIINSQDGKSFPVQAKLFLFTTGYKSKELIEKYFPNSYNVHLWKSHAIQIPLVKKHGFFFIDKGEVSVEPQGLYSIVCQSQEDTPIETANFDINKKIIEEIYNNLVKVLPEASAYKNNFAASACLKPSIISSTSKPLRNVGVEIHSLSKYAILALPGKATEAPYLADELVKIVFGYMSDPRIALRPGDDFIKNYGNN